MLKGGENPILTDRSVSPSISLTSEFRRMINQLQTPDENSVLRAEQAILEAAEYLFAEKGFDAVSMSAIASLANTSKPNIYHHFNSKKDLYLAVMHTAAQYSSALLDELADAPGTFQTKLSTFAAGQLGSIMAHKRRSQLILREALSGGSEKGRDIAKHVVGESFSRLVAMVRQGQQEDEFRADIDPTLAAFMIFSANVFFFQSAPVMRHIPEIQFTEDADSYLTGIMDILFNGVLQEGGGQL